MALDLTSLALSKKYTNLFQSGVESVTVNGTTINWEFTDGQTASMTFPQPADGEDGEDGVSITDISVDDNNHLNVSLSNNTIIDAGAITTVNGITPIKGTDYWTDADKIEIETYCKNYIDNTLLGGEF